MTTIVYPEMSDARWKRVRNALKRLAARGVSPWWIRERAPVLLEFECVRRLAVEDPEDPHASANALIRVLRELVEDFRYEPHGVVLRVVLGLDEPFVDHEGNIHSLLHLNASERRTLAGKEFRGGHNPVSEHAIRLSHEQVALDRLAHLLLRREIALTGFMHPTGEFETEAGSKYVRMYRPGETVPESGIYKVSDAHGHALDREATLSKGERFPLLDPDSEEAAWLEAALRLGKSASARDP